MWILQLLYINVWLPIYVIFKEKINIFSPEYNILFINIVVTYLYDIPIPHRFFVVKKNLFGVYNSNSCLLIYFYIIQLIKIWNSLIVIIFLIISKINYS